MKIKSKKDLSNYMKEFYKKEKQIEIQNEIALEKEILKKVPIFSYDFISEKKEKVYRFCRACNKITIHNYENMEKQVLVSFSCPHCNNQSKTKIWYQDKLIQEEHLKLKICYYDKESSIITGVLYETSFSYVPKNSQSLNNNQINITTTNDMENDELSQKNEILYYFVFHPNFGIYQFPFFETEVPDFAKLDIFIPNNFFVHPPYIQNDYFFVIKNDIYYDIEKNIANDFVSVFDYITHNHSKNEKKDYAQIRKDKELAKLDFYRNYHSELNIKEVESRLFDKNIIDREFSINNPLNPIFYETIEDYQGKTKLETHCICGHSQIMEYEQKNITCPFCNRSYELELEKTYGVKKLDSNIFISYFAYSESHQCLIILCFSSKIVLKSKEKTFSLSYLKDPYFICFLDKNSHYFLNENTIDFPWKQKKLLPYLNTININTSEELNGIINHSFLKNKGLEDAWGLKNKDFKISEIGDFDGLDSYLFQCVDKPWLELLLKSKLTRIFDNVIKNPTILTYDFNYEGKNIYQLLKITRPTFRILKELQLGISSIIPLREIQNYNPDFSLEIFYPIYQQIITPYNYDWQTSDFLEDCAFITSNYNIPIDSIFKYLESCKQYQCIVEKSSISIWKDYLNMAQQMNYDLTNKSIKYPSSLKKEHDKAAFSYKVVADEKTKEQFHQKTIQKLYLEFESQDYIIIVPRFPEEVIEEGTKLKHCVGSYVQNIIEEKCIVCFARKKQYPDNSFYTIEIKENKISQIKGLCNSSPSKDVVFMDFIKKWSILKKLTLLNHY